MNQEQTSKASSRRPALLPAGRGISPATEPRSIAIYPEHGTGRAAKLTTCRHCGGKPLLVRKCGRNRSCAVCQKCGFHHRLKLR